MTTGPPCGKSSGATPTYHTPTTPTTWYFYQYDWQRVTLTHMGWMLAAAVLAYKLSNAGEIHNRLSIQTVTCSLVTTPITIFGKSDCMKLLNTKT